MLQPPSESTTISGPDVSPAEIEAARRAALCESERADAISYDWARIGAGITTAGIAYPVVVSALMALFGILAVLWRVLSGMTNGSLYVELIGTIFLLIPIAFCGGVIGFLWSGFVTLLTLPVIYSIAWSLHLRTNIVWLGAFAGGLVGFICVLPLTLEISSQSFSGGYFGLVATLFLGPGLATIVGQLGGAWGAMQSREVAIALDWRRYLVLPPDAQGKIVYTMNELGKEPSSSQPPRFQFSIRQLLWVAVWLSLLLTLIRLCGIPYELILPLLVGWLLFQLSTLAIGRRLFRRLGPWWQARRLARST